MAKHSARFALVKNYYDRGLWSKARVARAVDCGWITAEEYAEITGEPFEVEG